MGWATAGRRAILLGAVLQHRINLSQGQEAFQNSCGCKMSNACIKIRATAEGRLSTVAAFMAGPSSVISSQRSDEAQYHGEEKYLHNKSEQQLKPSRQPIRPPNVLRRSAAREALRGDPNKVRDTKQTISAEVQRQPQPAELALRRAVTRDSSGRIQQGHRGAGRAISGGRDGRLGPVKKTWWTSEFNRVEGELEVRMPWWAEKVDTAYSDLKVAELKAELQRRGAKNLGTKAELIARLRELDRLYTMEDSGFREALVIDDREGRRLPSCFPEVYGDEFESAVGKSRDLEGDEGEMQRDTHR